MNRDYSKFVDMSSGVPEEKNLATKKDIPVKNNIEQGKLEVPDKNEFMPISTPITNDYVYYADDNVYLLPYQNLDFSIPLHRWMYYYYPQFYYSYYDTDWPFVAEPFYPWENMDYGHYWTPPQHYRYGSSFWQNYSKPYLENHYHGNDYSYDYKRKMEIPKRYRNKSRLTSELTSAGALATMARTETASRSGLENLGIDIQPLNYYKKVYPRTNRDPNERRRRKHPTEMFCPIADDMPDDYNDDRLDYQPIWPKVSGYDENYDLSNNKY